MENFLEIPWTTLSFQVKSVKSSMHSPVCESTAEINIDIYIPTYIPNMGLGSNTRFSVHLPREGSLRSPKWPYCHEHTSTILVIN